MKKIIGSLIVMSLLSQQPTSTVFCSPIVIQIEGNIPQVYFFTEKMNSRERIEYLLGQLSNNNRKIQLLLNKRNSNSSDIQLILSANARSKIKMTELQMEIFKYYSEYYEKLNDTLTKTLKEIYNRKDLNSVKEELLHSETNYLSIISELTNLNNSQLDAIENLSNLVEAGNMLLKIIK